VNLNACIGCGCDEAHACSMEHAGFTDGCWWLRFSAADRAGVCSRCEDLVPLWNRGVRQPLFDEVPERFHRQVMFLYDDEASARAWVNAPQPLLGNRSPRELIKAGELERVYALIDQLRDGVYA
jgi:hypothetical protein